MLSHLSAAPKHSDRPFTPLRSGHVPRPPARAHYRMLRGEWLSAGNAPTHPHDPPPRLSAAHAHATAERRRRPREKTFGVLLFLPSGSKSCSVTWLLWQIVGIPVRLPRMVAIAWYDEIIIGLSMFQIFKDAVVWRALALIPGFDLFQYFFNIKILLSNQMIPTRWDVDPI